VTPIQSRLLKIMLPLAAVAGFAAAPAMAQKQGGTLTVGVELDIAGFDPLKVGVYDTSANIAASLILEQLTRLGDDGKAKPSLALSWSPSEDYKVWTFKLRPDVKFHDGTPFNAQAVAWNFARQKDPKNNCRCAFYIANILSVEPKDDLTVVYTLKDPAVNFPAVLTRPDQNSTIHSPTALQAEVGYSMLLMRATNARTFGMICGRIPLTSSTVTARQMQAYTSIPPSGLGLPNHTCRTNFCQ